MKRVFLLTAFLLAACGKPEDDGDLKAAFAASALKDPSSVQLRNVQANDEVICGEYNSKNSYGAYGGFEPFVFNRSIKDLWLGDHDNAYSSSAFWKECPNAKELGLNDSAFTTTDMNATAMDMNATDMEVTDTNAAIDPHTAQASNAAERNAAKEAEAEAAAASKKAMDEATGLTPPTDDAYDMNNDAGE